MSLAKDVRRKAYFFIQRFICNVKNLVKHASGRIAGFLQSPSFTLYSPYFKWWMLLWEEQKLAFYGQLILYELCSWQSFLGCAFSWSYYVVWFCWIYPVLFTYNNYKSVHTFRKSYKTFLWLVQEDFLLPKSRLVFGLTA